MHDFQVRIINPKSTFGQAKRTSDALLAHPYYAVWICALFILIPASGYAAGSTWASLFFSGGKATPANYSIEATVSGLALWIPSLCVYPNL